MSLPRPLANDILLGNKFCIVESIYVRDPTLARLAMATRGEPSTSFPRELLVERERMT